ncbi:alpha/beta fold hydrolase [Sphingosinicella sp. CPCC 101087]|uniref:alpha/beta fold hydrolase n=1 Tax=Sphingosinicella sp. CPCC 101087 TaxID=2497754 RepID=UPI00101DE25E|nr:alpha/beta hydrolase [Sphingosinicella sp. CPCC 101087]
MSDSVFRSDRAAEQVEAQYRQVLEQWPVPRSELLVPTRHGPTFVVACGPEEAPPVVLLHGSQANSAAWIPDVSLWSSRFRLFAIDMIGEAGLSARVRPDLAGDAHALWLDDVFAGLGIGRAGFVGTSLGGWLALDYASRRPSAVRALALICPAGIGRQRNFLLRAAPLLLLGPWGKRKIREKVFGPARRALPAGWRSVAELMDAVGQAIQPRVVKIPQLTDEQLRQIDVPILAIVGGRDVLLDSRDTQARLKQGAPHAEICFIEEGYHFLPNQAARVMEFLERTVRPAEGDFVAAREGRRHDHLQEGDRS